MMISTMTILDSAPVSQAQALEEVGAGMTTLTTIGTMIMMMIGVVERQRHLVVAEGGMTMATNMMMTMIG